MNTTTFFSYKGGAGRSSTALNTLPYLVEALHASADRPILLIDTDLDSAGMTYLLDCDRYFQRNYDVKDMLLGDDNWTATCSGALSEHPLISKFVPVGNKLGVEDGAVLFLGDDDTKPFDNAQMTGRGEEVLRKLNQFARRNGIKAIVFDSAAGDQYSAVLSTGASSHIVCCMRPTMQFRVGTFNYLRRLAGRGMGGNIDQNVVLLPTVVPMQDMAINGKMQCDQARKNILDYIQDTGLEVSCDFLTEESFGINEVQRFKWQEGVLYNIGKTETLAEDEVTACSRYSKLGKLLAQGD